jgi:deoxycytidylate deaminase
MNLSKKEYIIKEAIKSAKGHHPCLKQSVYAMIEIGDKKVFGTNKMINNEVKECPRDIQGYVSGAGYHLCKDICQQEAHAEIDALKNAKTLGVDVAGGKLTLVGHTYCCNNCKTAMVSAGITEVEILG